MRNTPPKFIAFNVCWRLRLDVWCQLVDECGRLRGLVQDSWYLVRGRYENSRNSKQATKMSREQPASETFVFRYPSTITVFQLE